jgi:hypothetical protein
MSGNYEVIEMYQSLDVHHVVSSYGGIMTWLSPSVLTPILIKKVKPCCCEAIGRR